MEEKNGSQLPAEDATLTDDQRLQFAALLNYYTTVPVNNNNTISQPSPPITIRYKNPKSIGTRSTENARLDSVFNAPDVTSEDPIVLTS
jgi:hypothetical protein